MVRDILCFIILLFIVFNNSKVVNFIRNIDIIVQHEANEYILIDNWIAKGD